MNELEQNKITESNLIDELESTRKFLKAVGEMIESRLERIDVLIEKKEEEESKKLEAKYINNN